MGKLLKKIQKSLNLISSDDLISIYTGRPGRRYMKKCDFVNNFEFPDDTEEALAADMERIGVDLHKVINKQKHRLLNV